MSGSGQNGRLNEAQQRRLSATCVHIDRLLSDIEQALAVSNEATPFTRYVMDIRPALAPVLQDHIRQLRSQLVRALEWQGMKPGLPHIPVSRSVLSDLAFIDIALEELNPGYMRGSGEISPESGRDLSGVVLELRSFLHRMESYLREEVNAPLSERIRTLDRDACDVDLLSTIEQLVTKHGLVEFRPRIEALTDALEHDELEVALFGRVSSGKSSLLNALLGTDILPVGVNPIAAVPTRLMYGEQLRAAVRYASGLSETLSIQQFKTVVSEHGNPGNARHVAQTLVEIPSERLKRGIVLVDTPGLGSLARRGAKETLAYLPSCDLGIVLIDAAGTLNEEDIGTLRALNEAGVPAVLLLSKADLLSPDDVSSASTYIHDQVKDLLGIDLTVYAVSSLDSHSDLLNRFFEHELEPRFMDAKALRTASIGRKIEVLRVSLIATFETMLSVHERETEPLDVASIERGLRGLSGRIAELRRTLEQSFLELGELPDVMIRSATEQALRHAAETGESAFSQDHIASFLHDAVSGAVAVSIGQARQVAGQAIEALQLIGGRIGAADAPARDDAAALFRDVPGFATPAISKSIRIGFWKWLGTRILRSRVAASMRGLLGPSFAVDLHRYGQSLSLWGLQFIASLTQVTESYAELYRSQIRRTSLDAKQDVRSLERDLDVLRHWAPVNSSPLLQKRA